MAQSVRARAIMKQHGIKAAACYLRNKGWPLYLSLFVLTGKWNVNAQ